MAYQIAQKVHARTDPHDPAASVNDRARDVVALLLLRDLIDATQHPTLSEVRAAIEDIFTTRATETRTVGAAPRTWPTRGTAHAHWGPSFARAADSAGLTIRPRRCHRPVQRLGCGSQSADADDANSRHCTGCPLVHWKDAGWVLAWRGSPPWRAGSSVARVPRFGGEASRS
jgi:hypothetical protein